MDSADIFHPMNKGLRLYISCMSCRHCFSSYNHIICSSRFASTLPVDSICCFCKTISICHLKPLVFVCKQVSSIYVSHIFLFVKIPLKSEQCNRSFRVCCIAQTKHSYLSKDHERKKNIRTSENLMSPDQSKKSHYINNHKKFTFEVKIPQ